MGRKVLESLGCDNQEMLLAARDRYRDDVDVANRLNRDINEKESEKKMATLFRESVFHNSGQAEDDEFDEEDMYDDLGDACHKDIETELARRVSEAVTNGLSENGENKLKDITENSNSVFKIRLGSGRPANGKSIKMSRIQPKKPVKEKVRKYPQK